MNTSIENIKSEFTTFLGNLQNKKPPFNGTISSLSTKVKWLKSSIEAINIKSKSLLTTLHENERKGGFEFFKTEIETFISKNK